MRGELWSTSGVLFSRDPAARANITASDTCTAHTDADMSRVTRFRGHIRAREAALAVRQMATEVTPEAICQINKLLLHGPRARPSDAPQLNSGRQNIVVRPPSIIVFYILSRKSHPSSYPLLGSARTRKSAILYMLICFCTLSLEFMMRDGVLSITGGRQCDVRRICHQRPRFPPTTDVG